ncbi:hypothetical protein QAD02_021382 [Eretmocerus hayati]|uniref:Uncharacterized protein n=1 Tax=Eretmocerus hayati TaxID=131215 RepID=A0ACC2PQJ5_9HYME|nr:hypothetical protein QAD02_021382 [Eretmocerus hayati]
MPVTAGRLKSNSRSTTVTSGLSNGDAARSDHHVHPNNDHPIIDGSHLADLNTRDFNGECRLEEGGGDQIMGTNADQKSSQNQLVPYHHKEIYPIEEDDDVREESFTRGPYQPTHHETQHVEATSISRNFPINEYQDESTLLPLYEPLNPYKIKFRNGSRIVNSN